MTSNVVLYLGPARSGKTYELLRLYRLALQQTPPRVESVPSLAPAQPHSFGRALWIAPNNRVAGEVAVRLLDRQFQACLGPGITTFDRLSHTILDTAPVRRHRIHELQQRDLLRRLLADAEQDGKLDRFAGAAQRTGFIDLLAEHFKELQRRGLAPADYQKARANANAAAHHAELAFLYAEYMRRNSDGALFDQEGIHRAARDVLEGGCPRLDDLDLVVVDGFTDFTPIQHDILGHLARRAKCLLISLPYESEQLPHPRKERRPSRSANSGELESAEFRSDLFAKITATISALERRHPGLEIRHLPARSSGWPALDEVVRNLFRYPSAAGPLSADVLDSLDRLEIVAAAGTQEEICDIGRRIKLRLADRTARPGDFVVVFRTLAEAAPRVREVFEQFRIPYYLEANERLITAPAVHALLNLLRLDDEDWPFRRVVSIITNNSFTAFEGGSRLAAEWLVRDLQIAQGRRPLVERVRQLAAEPPLADRGERHARREQMARAADSVFTLLVDVFDQLPTEATPSEWHAALTSAAAALGLPALQEAAPTPATDRLDGPPTQEQEDDASPQIDQIAWQRIERQFIALEQLDAWCNRPVRRWSRRELISALIDVASKDSLPKPHDEVGRVRILSAHSARNITARHLYLAGMSEQSFPMPESVGRLATDADYRFLARAADQQLATPADEPTRAQDEMLLFYEIVSRAEESLTISYPALDDKAQPLPPSPYVLEIERTLGDDGLKRIRRPPTHLSPVPRDATAASLADWRIQAVAQSLEGDSRLLAGLFSAVEDNHQQHERVAPLAAALDAGIRIVHARARGDSFGPAEGLLAGPAAARLAKRFGPQHLWSPSQWETYASCPYKFFLRDVLRLEPLGDLLLETDFARRGSRLHDVLAAFHRRRSTHSPDSSRTDDQQAEDFLDELRRVIDERIDVTARVGIDAALLELDRRQLHSWAKAHFEHLQKYQSAFAGQGTALQPHRLEFRFGPQRPGGSDHDPDSTTEAFSIDLDGERILVTGQIDRIDTATIGGQTYFSVIDYKSGRVSCKPAQIESGERLQLPIYVEAAQALVFGGQAIPLAAGYWSMASGFDTRGALSDAKEPPTSERWDETRTTVRHLVRQFVDGIRHGDFPVDSRDEKCTGYCEFRSVCRVSQVRSLKKKWVPPDEAQ